MHASELRRPVAPNLELTADAVVRPKHYTSHPSGIEPLEIARHESFVRGNIIKYVMRAPYKGAELEDLKKARFYLEQEIARVERRSSEEPRV